MTKLTNKKVAELMPRDKRYTVSDGLGLSIRIHPTGTKSWIMRTSFNGTVSDKFLGNYPEMTIQQARQIVRKERKNIGLTPPRAYTLNDAFSLWKGLKRNRIVSYKDEKRRLEKYILRHIGSKQIDEITAPLVIYTVKHLEQCNKLSTLKRVLMRTREILDLAVCAGYIQHNPIERVSRVFPPPKVTSMAAIDWKELPHAFQCLENSARHYKLLFLFSLCSMLRPGENAKLRKSWITEESIVIPAKEMKKEREHRVPLTPHMRFLLFLIQKESKFPRSDFVFVGRQSGTHISSQALAKHLHNTNLKNKLVAHGLRSIARSWLADQNVNFEIAESCLSHVVGSSVSRAYQRSDYFELRSSVMYRWNSFVFDCAKSANFLDDLADFHRLGQ